MSVMHPLMQFSSRLRRVVLPPTTNRLSPHHTTSAVMPVVDIAIDDAANAAPKRRAAPVRLHEPADEHEIDDVIADVRPALAVHRRPYSPWLPWR